VAAAAEKLANTAAEATVSLIKFFMMSLLKSDKNEKNTL
jgi:hypothetical protein